MIALLTTHPWLTFILVGSLLGLLVVVIYQLGELLYQTGVQNGFLYHRDPKVRDILIEAGINVEWEIDKMVALHERKRSERNGLRAPPRQFAKPTEHHNRMST